MASPKANGRMIRKSISESKGFASLSPEAAVLFSMLIPHYNVHGKLHGGPGFLKDEIVPLLPYLTYENIPGLMQEISDKTNVKWFKDGNKWWVHSLNFNTEHQDLNEQKKGPDVLPSYVNSETTPELLPDYSETTPELLPDSPFARKVLRFKDLKEEDLKEESNNNSSSNARVENIFIECFNQNENRIRELYPHADYESERETCIAYYRVRPPPLDCYPVILKWFNRISKQQGSIGEAPGKHPRSQEGKGREKEPGVEKTNPLTISVLNETNLILSKNFTGSKDAIRNIEKRLAEGRTIEDFKTVCQNMLAAWGKDEKMFQYLCPETLYGEKFDKYLNTSATRIVPIGFASKNASGALERSAALRKKELEDANHETRSYQ